MLNDFTPRFLSETINQIQPPKATLRDLVFSKPRNATAEYVQFEIVTSAQKLAAFRARGREANVVDKQGRKLVTFRIPSIREKKPFAAADTLRSNAPGTGIYADAGSLQQAAKLQAAQELADFKERMTRTKEWLCAQALTGGITITLDDYDIAIDFGVASSHKPTLTSTAKWDTDANVDIPANLRTWKKLISRDSGYTPDRVILGSDAADLFIANSKVKALLDNKGIAAGKLDLQSNSNYLGSILGLDFYEHTDQYVNASGTATDYVAAGAVIMVASAAPFHFWHGPVDDLDANFGVMEFFSKTFRTQDPSVDWLLVASAPVPIIHHTGAIVYATVK